MTERTFLQQLFLLQQDIDACPMLDAFAAQQRQRWAARLGELLMRRNAALSASGAGVGWQQPIVQEMRETAEIWLGNARDAAVLACARQVTRWAEQLAGVDVPPPQESESK